MPRINQPTTMYYKTFYLPLVSQFKGDHATFWKPVKQSREVLTLGSIRHCKDSTLVICFLSTATSSTKGFLQTILVLSTLTPNFVGDNTGVYCKLLSIILQVENDTGFMYKHWLYNNVHTTSKFQCCFSKSIKQFLERSTVYTKNKVRYTCMFLPFSAFLQLTPTVTYYQMISKIRLWLTFFKSKLRTWLFNQTFLNWATWIGAT